MRKLLTGCNALGGNNVKRLCLLIVLCLPLGAVHAAPTDEAMSIVNRWMTAFGAGKFDDVVSLYASDALFFGTGSKTLVKDPAGIAAYFRQGAAANTPVSAVLRESSSALLSPTIVLITGLDTLTGERGGVRTTSNGRVTFVVSQRDGQWKIVHFHRSAVPD